MSDAVFTFPPGHTDRIFGCNRTGSTIPAHTPVEILAAERPRRNSEVVHRVPYLLRRITPETTVIGVTLTDIPNSDWGEVQVSGLVPCNIATSTLAPNFVLAGDGELIPAGYGWPVFTISAPRRITFVLLNGCYGNYLGSFAVIKRDSGFYCLNSAQPDSAIAGSTDLGDVPAGTITATNGRFSLYLWYDEENYQQSFSCPSVSSYGIVTLAELVNGFPRQCWTQGLIHWTQWYLL